MSIEPDLSSLIYSTGTVSIATGSTTLTGNGTAWLVSSAAPVVRPGDTFSKNGFQIPVYEVEANGTIELAAPWPGAPLVGATYQIIKGSPYRQDEYELAVSIRNLVQALAGMTPVFRTTGVPDNSLGQDGNWAFRLDGTTLIPYAKIADVWSQLTLGGQWTVNGANISYGAGRVSITDATASTSTATGALTVNGGLGVGGAIYAGSSIIARSGTNGHIRLESGSPTITGWLGWYLANGTRLGFMGSSATNVLLTMENGAVFQIVGGVVGINSTQASTSTTTGALTVAGGVGIGGNAFANSFWSNNFTLIGATSLFDIRRRDNNASAFALYSAAGELSFFSGGADRVRIAGDGAMTILSTVASTSTATGALTVAGGVGVGGWVVASNLFASATAAGGAIEVRANNAGTTANSLARFYANLSGIANAYIVTQVYTNGVSVHTANIATGVGISQLLVTSDIHTFTSQNSGTAYLSLNATRTAVQQTTASTSTTTGALTVAGGVGVGGAMNIGGGVNVGGSVGIVGLLTVNGNTTDVPKTFFVRGLSYGVRIGSTGVNAVIDGVDVTGVASYQPLMIGGSTVAIQTGGTVKVIVNSDGGVTIGAATGGSKGIGTINAVGVYDDNVLLTCFGIEYLIDGTIDVAKWDGYAPLGKHQLVRSFLDMIGDDFDPRDHRSYIDKMIRERGLPGMPTQSDWQHNTLSTGEMTNRLWLSAELQASAFKSHVDETQAMAEEITQLRGRVAELEQATRH